MSFTRRRFLDSLRLSAGAALLYPIASSLYSEAQGAEPTNRRVVFCVVGNGINWEWNFTPKGLAPGGQEKWDPANVPKSGFELPPMMKSLAPYRDRMLLLDGLSNQVIKSQHGIGYGLLSCVNTLGDAEYGGPLVRKPSIKSSRIR